MSNKVKLEDVASLTVGFVGNMTKEYVDTGVSFFRSLNIKPFYLDDKDLLHISSEFNEKIKKSKLREGDIVIVRTGQPGTCCVIPKEYDGCNCSDLVIVRPNKDKVNPHYLEAYINFMTQKQINNHQVGAIQKHFNVGSAKEMILYLPEIRTQEKCADIVKVLNKKIENNNRINSELESMAKTIYDYWFLQFDFPDENGKPYKSSGGKMMWNDKLKKEIPEKWSVGTLSRYIAKDKGGDWGKEVEEGKYIKRVICLRGADFPSITGNSKLVASVRYILEKNKSKILENGDLIIEISGGSPTQSTGRICYINNNLLERFEMDIVTSNFCKAISLNDPNHMYWFYVQWLKIYDNNVLFKYEGKTTGIKNLLFDMFINDYEIAVPPNELIIQYNNMVCAMYDEIQKKQKESQELVSLRDFLLPLLMNGQVGFK